MVCAGSDTFDSPNVDMMGQPGGATRRCAAPPAENRHLAGAGGASEGQRPGDQNPPQDADGDQGDDGQHPDHAPAEIDERSSAPAYCRRGRWTVSESCRSGAGDRLRPPGENAIAVG